jgi:hypothetical protein
MGGEIMIRKKEKHERLQTFLVNIGLLNKGKKVTKIEKSEDFDNEDKKALVIWFK